MGIVIDDKSFALRPLRIIPAKDELVFYEGTTFPRNPHAGVLMLLRRLVAFGFCSGVEADSPIGNLGVDILAENGDILHTFNITRKGFEYLRRTLKFRVERT